MEKIILKSIEVQGSVLVYHYNVTDGLKKYFSGIMPLTIDYCCDGMKLDFTIVPQAILAVPFVCNVLPIIWLTDSELFLPELDKVFYDCIPEVRAGYETMYPESKFAGNVIAEKVIECDIPTTGRCAAFYSGGLDSVQTLVSHLDEKPDLISIWGSDIRYDNVEGWRLVHSAIEEISQRFNLSDIVIHSTFREFDNESVLHSEFHNQLKDSWWHGVKHGIGLLGHVAPYAYLYGLSAVYIASSNCPADGLVRCASNPLIDNHVRFANCKVIHDGFEFSRQDKVHNVVEFCRQKKCYIPLHVCWQSQEGGNCCHCEKCYRTIAGLLAEGENPEKYGFNDIVLENMQQCIIEGGASKEILVRQWTHIHNRVCDNKQFLREKSYWKYIRWLLYADFNHPENLKIPIMYRIRRKLSNYKFYQYLHRLKVRK